ncbi:unnamed protein product [Blepharisma stoltei]|uniref:Ion transport domain-containing protein n=1 Tax=Blepharisma stoltei TaxID=1481888 RepID=A0AAU9JEK8_9CILI|nr:unnamed protein product [Blepharisma stoltei]
MENISNTKGVFSPIEIISASNLLKKQRRNLKVMLSRFYYSKISKILYLFFIMLTVWLLAGIIFGLSQLYFAIAVILLVLMLILAIFEVVYRVFMEGNVTFFSEKWNIADVTCLSISCLICCISFGIAGLISYAGEILAVLINLVRLLLIYFKLLRMLNRMKNTEISVNDLNGYGYSNEVQTPTSKDVSDKEINDQEKYNDGVFKFHESSRTDESEG